MKELYKDCISRVALRRPIKNIIVRETTVNDCVVGLDDALINRSTYCRTALDGDKIIFICGLHIVCDGVGEVWLHPGPYIREYIREVYWWGIIILDDMESTFSLRRLQAITGDLLNARFLERLGFTFEGFMRKLLPDGSDALLYGRTRWKH
jgi:hypothetical protein